jgi:hypothetical protein
MEQGKSWERSTVHGTREMTQEKVNEKSVRLRDELQ